MIKNKVKKKKKNKTLYFKILVVLTKTDFLVNKINK